MRPWAEVPECCRGHFAAPATEDALARVVSAT